MSCNVVNDTLALKKWLHIVLRLHKLCIFQLFFSTLHFVVSRVYDDMDIIRGDVSGVVAKSVGSNHQPLQAQCGSYAQAPSI